MNRELYLTLMLFAATVLAIWGFLLVLSPFLASIGWALCLAAITFPAYRLLRARWRKPRVAALVLVVVTAVVILVPLAMTVLMAGEELIRLGQSGIPKGMGELKEAMPSFYAWLNGQLKEVGVEGGVEHAAQKIGEAAPAILWGPLARGAWDVLGSFFTAIMGLIIMLATQYFVYTEGPRLMEWVRSLLPLSDQDTDKIFQTLTRTTASAVLGGLVVALVQGLLGGIGYAVAGIQAPILWGLVTAVFSLLPVGGSALIWGPIVIYLFAIGETGRAWFLLPWGMVIVGGVDNVLRPWLLRRTGSRVHPMLLFFAILSGIGLFGVSGIVFGPLLIAVLVTLAQIYREYMAGGKVLVVADGAAAQVPAEAPAPVETPAPAKAEAPTAPPKKKPSRRKRKKR